MGPRQDIHERVLVELVQRDHDRQSADQLGNQPVPQQVFRLHAREPVLVLGSVGFAISETDLPFAEPAVDDVFESVERAAANEQDVARVDLDVLLLGVLASSLRGYRRDGAFEDLEQRLLDALTRYVARDRRVLALPSDLVDLVDVYDAPLALRDVVIARLKQADQDVLDVLPDVPRLGQRRRIGDGERYLQHASERLREERLAHPRRSEKKDVRLLDLDVIDDAAVVDALVVIVDGDGEGLLRVLLADHVLVQHVLDLDRDQNVGDLAGSLALLLLGEDFVTQRDALVADVDVGPRDELLDAVLRFPAERATKVLIVRHARHSLPAVRSHRGGYPSMSVSGFTTPATASDSVGASPLRAPFVVPGSITRSIKPYSTASSGDMYRSRSTSSAIFSMVCPVCDASSSLSRCLAYSTSRA